METLLMTRLNLNMCSTPVLLLAVSALHGQTTGSIKGVVLENGIRPLAGATVSYRDLGRVERDSNGAVHIVRPKTGIVIAGSDGTFTINGLAADRYIVCAGGPLPVHIGSCTWD